MSRVPSVRSAQHRRLVLVGTSALILVVIVGLSYREWRHFHGASVNAALGARIRDSTTRLLNGILDAETGQRGFLLTGEARYLQPYDRALRTVPAELSTLNVLLAQRPAQAGNVGRLNSLVREKMAELQRTIELQRTRGHAPALDLVLSDEGRLAMEQLRGVIAAIQASEQTAEQSASIEGEAATRSALLVTIAGSLALLFVLVAGLDVAMRRKPSGPRASRVLTYGVAAGATLLAFFLRVALTALIGRSEVPYITFFPAVLLSAWYGGLEAGVAAIVLSVAAVFFSDLKPLADVQYVTVLLFVLMSAGIALVAHAQKRALERADRAVAQRRAAENAERVERERFEATLASIGDAVVSTDAEGRITFANRIALSLLRRPRSEVLGKPIVDVFCLVDEQTREPVENPVLKVLRDGGTAALTSQTLLVAADGTEIPIDDSGAPVRDSRGNVSGVVLVFRDIAERRTAEKKLAEQASELSETAQRFQTLAGAIPQLAWMAHPDGWIFWYNDRWYEYTGTTPGEMVGWGWQAVHDPAVLPKVLERWEACLSCGAPLDMTFPLRGADGRFRPFLTRVMPLRAPDGKVIRWFGTNTDVSEQLQTEDALRRSEARLERANAELKRSNEDLERFAFVASHDLQEPLRILTTYAELLVRKLPEAPDAEARSLIGHLVDAANRMRELLHDLLVYARIGSRLDLAPEAVDLQRVVNDVKENLKAAIEESGAVIECDQLPGLHAHAAHLVPLFQNLVANSIKYRSDCPPRIRVAAPLVNGEQCFVVSDNGIGIDPQYHRKIFEAFQRLHRDGIPGTGMGLAICQRIVERYGGRIWVESQPGKGSDFFFTLPEPPRTDMVPAFSALTSSPAG